MGRYKSCLGVCYSWLVSWLVRAMPCLLNDSGVLKLRNMGVPVPGAYSPGDPSPSPLETPDSCPKPKYVRV